MIPEEYEWINLLWQHQSRYPAMQPQDTYKLLYQGVRGPEHLIDNVASFIADLQTELAQLAPDPDRELLEPIRPDGRLCRIHLSAWLDQCQSLEELAVNCLQTAQQTWNNAEDLAIIWKAYSEKESTPELIEFTTWLDAHDFPAVHHSEIYRTAYAPAYRLVTSDSKFKLK